MMRDRRLGEVERFVQVANAALARRQAVDDRDAGRVGEGLEPRREALEEIGVDAANRKPRALTRDDVDWADLVVTMGCGDACPVIPGKRYVDWELPDPVGLCLEEVRELRADIERRVADLP